MTWDKELEEANEQYSFSELKQDKKVEEFNKQADEFDKEQSKQNLNDRETILIYGQPKVGKTYATCSFIENTIKNKGHIFIINTDNGTFRTLKTYFKKNYEEIKKQISYYLILDFENIFNIVKEIKQKVKPNDLIIIDLIDDFWEMAQLKFVQDTSGGDIVNYIALASKERDKFGLFDSMKWNYIKKLDDLLIREIVISPPCNVLACCGSKDIDVQKVFAKKDQDTLYELSKYEDVGSRPAGQKMLHYKFNTVVYLGEKRDGKRYLLVMGDRGFMKSKDKVEYQDNFYEAFMRLRK